MKIGFNPQQFFDDQGRPLSGGRLSLYAQGTDNLVPVWTWSGEFVSAENPVILDDAGRTAETLWFEASVIDVKLEKLNDDGTYAQLDTYSYGMDMPSGTNESVVTGLSGLKGASPSLGTVTVVGYHSAFDAPSRTYVWDPLSTDTPDDGCVVLSDVEPTGRWLLVWPDEKLPASVYGVVPGHLYNMANLMNRPRYYGNTYVISAPGTTSFPAGNFGTASSNSYSTGYDLQLDMGTRFGQWGITAPRFSVSGTPTAGIGKLRVDQPEGTASAIRLSEISDRVAFLTTDANMYVIDRDNTSGSSTCTLYNKLVVAFTAIPSWLTFEDSLVLRVPDGTAECNEAYVNDRLHMGQHIVIENWHDGISHQGIKIKNGNYVLADIDQSLVSFHNTVQLDNGFRVDNDNYFAQFDGDSDKHWGMKGDAKIDLTAINTSTDDIKFNYMKVTGIADLRRVDTNTIYPYSDTTHSISVQAAGIFRSYGTPLDLAWTSYGSHGIPADTTAHHIRITTKNNGGYDTPLDFLYIDAFNQSTLNRVGEMICIENCGDRLPGSTFSDLYANGEMKDDLDDSRYIFVLRMANSELVDVIPPFTRKYFRYDGSKFVAVSI